MSGARAAAIAALVILSPLAPPQAAADAAEAMAAVQARYPGTKVEAAEETPLPGLFRYVMGGESVYGDASGRYLILGGVLVDMERESLPRAPDYAAAAAAAVELQAGGDGELVLFSDPLCPYCLRLERRIAEGELDGFRILLVLAPFLPGSETVARQILCQRDPGAAYRAYMLEGAQPRPCARDLLGPHLAAARGAGIDATPTLLAPSGAVMRGLAAPGELRGWAAAGQRR